MKPKILVLHHREYNEKLYPHLYEVLEILKENFELEYFCDSITKYGLFAPSLRIKYNLKIGLQTLPTKIKKIFNFYKRYLITKLKREKCIKNLLKMNFDKILVIDNEPLKWLHKFYDKEIKSIIFWSLDIPVPHFSSKKLNYEIAENQMTAKYLKHAKKIIIQDINRAAVFDSLYNTYNIPKFYLPVSLKKNININEENRIKNSANKIIMQITGSVLRGTDLLIDDYQNWNSEYELWLQGLMYPEMDMIIEKCKRKPLVFRLFEEISKFRENISKVDIGFLSYNINDLNHFFISKSSGQLVEFLMQRKPIIVYKPLELCRFVEENKIGICIDKISEIQNAAEKIMNDYENYSSNSLKTFEKYFNLNRFEKKLINEYLM